MPTVNDLLIDEAIRHQVQLAKYSNDVVRRMITVLNRSEQGLFERLRTVLDRVTPSTFQIDRLSSMLGSVAAQNSQAYAQVKGDLRKELQDFTVYETNYQMMVLEDLTPVEVHVARVVPEQVYAAAMSRPFQGVLLQGVLDDLDQTVIKKIRQKVAQGYVENKTTDQIVRELRGSRAVAYADGLMEGNRRQVEAVVRTSLSHTAGTAHDAVAKANVDLLKAVTWSSTLDLRTSEICRIRDGKQYHPVTHKPIGHALPWLGGPGRAHWNCRSAQVFVTKGLHDLLGVKDPNVKTRNGTRASMDGQVAKDTTYADWLQRQGAARQDEVLGPTRAKLMRDGKLPLERMYGLKGQFLSLEELRASDAAAFKRAGL